MFAEEESCTFSVIGLCWVDLLRVRGFGLADWEEEEEELVACTTVAVEEETTSALSKAAAWFLLVDYKKLVHYVQLEY